MSGRRGDRSGDRWPPSGRDPVREPPVSRRRVLAIAAAVVAAVAALMAGIDLLRHPEALPGPEVDIAVSDPREELQCPGVQPREGVERDDPAVFEALPPVAVSSGDLLDCPEFYDGRRVIYRGEAVGQVLGRGPRRWIQVNDDAYAGVVGPLPVHRFFVGGNSGLGVRAPADALRSLRYRGGPRAHGDQVEVRGVFHRTDPVSREIAVIVADEFRVVAEGQPLAPPRQRDRQVVAYVLAVVAVVVVVHGRRRSR